ncbi:MAG: hypothetical protein ABFR75_03205 [Acidobacteriota bacterium]
MKKTITNNSNFRIYNLKFYKTLLIILFFCFSSVFLFPVNSNRWQIDEEGSIIWVIRDKIPHYDHLEMSGKRVSAVIRYSIGKKRDLKIHRTIVWPMLRTIPNDTHASLIRTFNTDIIREINVNGRLVNNEKIIKIRLNGILWVKSLIGNKLELIRRIFPSTELPVLLEKFELKNLSNKDVNVGIPGKLIVYTTDKNKGVDGSYSVSCKVENSGNFNLKKGESVEFAQIFSAKKSGEKFPVISADDELKKRKRLIKEFSDKLIFESPDKILNNAFFFAKIRASESIFQTRGGPMHGPGGTRYYAAIWANDQAEYVGPFFPYLGYEYGNNASINAYLHFARFINDKYKYIPSSIIAEGLDIWDGAGDRGDAAMISYGASRFVLALGDKKVAKKIWPLIKWTLEYNKRKLNSEGVVSSDSDELEGRFPSGDANLSTSSLYYDALISAGYLGKELNIPETQLKAYRKQAEELFKNIEKFFGSNIMGYNTYRYYKGNDILRSWICMPLTVGIYSRKEETIKALFSPKLWTPDGLATQSGDKTFWDRSTLYALRGVFSSGETEKALNYLHYYSNRRLLGEHVPYPVEAYPEGDQRHLSAESGLYCRIFTEGMFGIRPVGLRSFELTPRLPESWRFMNLRNIYAFKEKFNIKILRIGNKISVKIIRDGKILLSRLISNGKTILFTFI